MTISSIDPRNQGPEALGVLFYESSHGLAVAVQNAISRECRQRDKPIPRNLWHALIYYTTSEEIRPILMGTGMEPGLSGPGGQQKPKFMTLPDELKDNLTQRGWEDYLHVLTMYWQPYLDGKVNFEDAIAHMISAI